MHKKINIGAIVLLVLGATSSTLHAQAQQTSHLQQQDGDNDAENVSTLRRFGYTAALALMRSSDHQTQLRGIERLGAMGDWQAVQHLVYEMRHNNDVAANAQARVAAVRVMAPFAARQPVTELLKLWAFGAYAGDTPHSMWQFANDQAAMALAASRDKEAMRWLLDQLIRDSPAAQRAYDALCAHPFGELTPILTGKATEHPRVVQLLGDIGDLRTISLLRKLVDNGDIAVQAQAALALAKLGDSTGTTFARKWMNRDGATEQLRVDVARILAITGDSHAPDAMAHLLSNPLTFEQGLELALIAPSAKLAPVLAKVFVQSSTHNRAKMLMALALSEGHNVAAIIADAIQKNTNDIDALYALGQIRNPQANKILSSMLQNRQTRKMAARASIVRFMQQAQLVDGLIDALVKLSQSSDHSERYVGLFGLAVIGKDAGPLKSVNSLEPTELGALCTAAVSSWPWRSLQQVQRCARNLSEATDPRHRDIMAAALWNDCSVDKVSTKALFDWAQTDRVSGPVFARWAAIRSNDAFEPRLRQLVFSGDRNVRSQSLIGLSQSRWPPAFMVAINAYKYETDPILRRAAVIGASPCVSAICREHFQRVALLDPDPLVRQLANYALAGVDITRPRMGNRVLWLQVKSNALRNSSRASLSKPHLSDTGGYLVGIHFSSGFSTVAYAPSDGHLLVTGLESADIQVKVDIGDRLSHAVTDVSKVLPKNFTAAEKKHPNKFRATARSGKTSTML